jgi:hypothetical protein
MYIGQDTGNPEICTLSLQPATSSSLALVSVNHVHCLVLNEMFSLPDKYYFPAYKIIESHS